MYKMDDFNFSVVVILSLLSLCGRCEAYIMDKDTDEKLIILAIVLVVILVLMLILLVIAMWCFFCRRKTNSWNATNSVEYKNATSFRMKESSPFYGASHSQGRKKESVFLPDYETVGPAYGVYENPGVNGSVARKERAEEPNHNYEHLDLGKKEPVSFTNEGYEATAGTFQATPEPIKEKESNVSNAEVIENQYTIQTTSERNVEKDSSGSYNINGGTQMGTTSYTFQTTRTEAAAKESSDPYTVLTNPNISHYQALSRTVSSSDENDTAF